MKTSIDGRKGAAVMNTALTIQEKLKDLRVAQGLTLEQLAEQTGLSKSALGKYESDEVRDISPFAIVTLAKLYGVSADYLLGMAENKNHPNTELAALHLSDNAIDSIKNGQFNKRLLSELLAHEKFQRLMLDAEIYVDRIADARINDLNFMLEISRKQAALQYAPGENALDMRTLELAQIQTGDYFSRVISDDLTGILKDIREAHTQDAMTADDISVAAEVGKRLQDAMNYDGSKQEKQARVYLASLEIDYDAITKEEFVTLIGILEKSKKLKIQKQRQRGKASPHPSHGKGKKKRK